MLTESAAAAAAPAAVTGHPAHPEHELKLVATGGAQFRCNGCKQLGVNERWYRCKPCDYDLHVCCAPLSQTLAHPFFGGRTFAFLHCPPAVPAGCSGRTCDACGDPVLGFLYHDAERQADLHPQCASQPLQRVVDGEVVELCKEAPVRGSCGLCGKGQGCSRASFWCYRAHDRYLHLACIMEADQVLTQLQSGSRSLLQPQASAPPMTGSWQQASPPPAWSWQGSALPAGPYWQGSAPPPGPYWQGSTPSAGAWQGSAPPPGPCWQGNAPPPRRSSGSFGSFCKYALPMVGIICSIANLGPVEDAITAAIHK